jgi:Zn finger protein HypA/HybF involved in hydrogenase expression
VTDNVVDLAAKRAENTPHASGEARCLDCKYEYVAVAPLGVTWMECPKCSLMRSRFIFAHTREGPYWECNCGNSLFHATKDGMYCPNCGEWQKGF